VGTHVGMEICSCIAVFSNDVWALMREGRKEGTSLHDVGDSLWFSSALAKLCSREPRLLPCFIKYSAPCSEAIKEYHQISAHIPLS